MSELPKAFLQVMQEILKEEYDDFLAGFTGKRYRALRVNPLRADSAAFAEYAPFPLRAVPWVEGGYFYEDDLPVSPSRHPYYAAGVYYLQEPSAMTPASRLPVEPGDRVLDLCAAPGGKATSLGAALQGQGLLVANDINRARARALLHNIELFGIPNAFVTSEAPHVLEERFPDYFDKIMVDAPCSGEGMFRKNPAVIEAWMEKGPDYFSRLQKQIILSAAKMLRPGGMMFYSTCTFSPLENEAVISCLLRERPDMELIPMADYEGFSAGLTSFAGESFDETCRLCRRIWPHRMEGEGHFLALLRKKEKDGISFMGTASAGSRSEEDSKRVGIDGRQSVKEPAQAAKEQDRMAEDRDRRGKKARKKKEGRGRKKDAALQNRRPWGGLWWEDPQLFDREESQNLDRFFPGMTYPMEPERIRRKGNRLFYVPSEVPENAGLYFLRNGVFLGEVKKRRFEPAQPLALLLSGDTFRHSLSLPWDDPRLNSYLKGETLELTEEEAARIRESGNDGKESSREKAIWVLLLADGYPLGFGRLAGGILKNKYPAGWRQTF